jgi:hypothetical protein
VQYWIVILGPEIGSSGVRVGFCSSDVGAGLTVVDGAALGGCDSMGAIGSVIFLASFLPFLFLRFCLTF